MSSTPLPRSVRVVPGEIQTKSVTLRLLLPTEALPGWPPFVRLAEGIATRGRRLPKHAHEREEVLTFILEGFATYRLETGATESLASGSARLLTAVTRQTHEVNPAEGASTRWFNLVVGLPRSFAGPDRLQSLGADSPTVDVDTVQVRHLVGPRDPLQSAVGLQCESMTFVEESTTFRKVGPTARAILYAWAGEGAVDEHPVSAGESVLIEGVPGVSVRGGPGFRGIWASAPVAPA